MSETIRKLTPEQIEAAESAISLVEDGLSLRKACEKISKPRKTIEDWIQLDETLSAQYERAREVRADKIFDEILEIADTQQIGTVETSKEWGVEVKSADMVEHRRLRIDARKWMLGKMAPKKYGDKLDVGASGTIAVTIKRYSDEPAA